MTTTKKASELTTGDWAVEGDGAEWLISAVEPVGRTRVRLTLRNAHGYIGANAECARVFHKETRIRVRCAA
jgi:hypothetical protein